MKQPWMLAGGIAFFMGAIVLCLYLVAMLTNRNARRNLGLRFGLLPCAILLGTLHFVMPVPIRTNQTLTLVSIFLTVAWLLLWLRVLSKTH